MRERLAAGLLGAEGLTGLVWTIALLGEEDLGSAFLPPDVPPGLVRTFVLADVLFYALLPLAASAAIAQRHCAARPLLWLHGGGITYAWLWGLGLLVTTGHGLAGVLLMTAPVALCAWLLLYAGPRRDSG